MQKKVTLIVVAKKVPIKLKRVASDAALTLDQSVLQRVKPSPEEAIEALSSHHLHKGIPLVQDILTMSKVLLSCSRSSNGGTALTSTT